MSHGSSSSSRVRDVLHVRVVRERPVLGDPRGQPIDVEPVRRVDPARDVRDGEHLRAPRGEVPRSDAADVPEALDDAALLGEVPAEPQARALDDHHDAGAGCLAAEDGAADRDRLAGDDLRNRVTDLHRVRVHHPGHRLLVRRHVGRRDVLLRADHRQQLDREPPRQTLELVLGHLDAGCSGRRLSRRRTGSRSNAHFQVIHIASAAHSPSETWGS